MSSKQQEQKYERLIQNHKLISELLPTCIRFGINGNSDLLVELPQCFYCVELLFLPAAEWRHCHKDRDTNSRAINTSG